MFTRGPFADLKRAGKARGVTVNDTLLAAVAGMLRRYLEAAGAPTWKPLVALVPVSVRRPGEEGANAISTVLVDLPSTSPTPARRSSASSAAVHAAGTPSPGMGGGVSA